MPTQEQTTPPVDAEATASDVLRKTGTAAVLGGVAAVSLAAEVSGVTHDMPSTMRAVVESGAHPVLGYAGAWAADAVSGSPVGRFKTKIAFLGATLSNFTAETAQSALVAAPEYINFLSSRNLPETTKDYLFALGGMAFYLWQSRRD